MKFFEVDTGYYINLEDISIFHIYMMDANDYKGYNHGRNPSFDKLQFMLHVVYKSGPEDGIYYALTTYDRDRFMEAIKPYVV